MKTFKTPVGFFSAESKKDILEFMAVRYPGIKKKEIESSDNKQNEPVINIEQLRLRELKIKDVADNVRLCMKNTPTRFFEIGERVNYGNFDEMYVTEIHENGLFYTISDGRNERFPTWIEIQKYRCNEDNDKITVLRDTESLHLNFGNTSISSLFTYLYHFGVEVDPPYQRGLEWSLTDKQLLIDSILKDLDIGKFVFVHNEYEFEKPGYTILDGKQRLNAIQEFYEDRFTYKGLRFSDMNYIDQNMIKGKSISYAHIEGRHLKEKDIVKYFLRLNQSGVAVSQDHLLAIAKQYDLTV